MELNASNSLPLTPQTSSFQKDSLDLVYCKIPSTSHSDRPSSLGGALKASKTSLDDLGIIAGVVVGALEGEDEKEQAERSEERGREEKRIW